MGRIEKSQGLAPPAIRKDIRAKQARNIVNKVVPSILASNARARRGVDGSELLTDSEQAPSKEAKKIDEGGDVAYVKRKGQGRRKAKGGDAEEKREREEMGRLNMKGKKSEKRRNKSIEEDMLNLTLDPVASTPMSSRKERTVRIITTDSLTAAKMLSSTHQRSAKKSSNVCILNMASPLCPGGGVLAGATSQEEFLCARTTLLPSLKESFYRLPEYGGIYTPDVFVFRSPDPLKDNAGELEAGERYYVDVITAAMLRFPDLEGEDDAVKTLTKKDREIVRRKMRTVLRIAETKCVKKLVLGAWGCGAYGNPVADIAEAWASALSSAGPDEKKRKTGMCEMWPDLEEVVFAIPNPRMAVDFAQTFGGGVEVESGPQSFGEDKGNDDEDEVGRELRAKIEEMEGQISKVWNPELKSRLGFVLHGLKAQLKERGDNDEDSDENGAESCEDEGESDACHDEIGRNHAGLNVDADELGTESSDTDNGVALKP